MLVINKKESTILFIGDILLLLIALWATLWLRYLELPSSHLFIKHLIPFSILFFVWFLVFFIAGLYEKQTIFLKSRLPTIILNAQIVNSFIAVGFFYFIPYFGITPKTNLFIDLVLSFAFIFLWRVYGVPFLGFRKKQQALLIASGKEMEELKNEVNNNSRYNLSFVHSIDLDKVEHIDFKEEILSTISSEGIASIVIDVEHKNIEKLLPSFYNLIFSKVHFINMYKVYEDIFDRIPLSLVAYSWFLENISFPSHLVYDFLKRAMDIVISIALGLVSLIFYPFVYIAIKLEDGGPIIIKQKRIGKGNKVIEMIKFRSMNTNDNGIWLSWSDTRVTKVGKFLRKTRIDELPQLWNILKGDVSLIGPRPDIIDIGKTLVKEIPYYTVRNLVKPGLSGWAQIKQTNPPQSVEETKLRLAYDLYYIKNRSFILDFKIALKTIKTLISRTGI